MSGATSSTPVKTWKHGPIPEYSSACLSSEGKPNASLKDLSTKKKQLWVKIEGAVMYFHLSKFSRPLEAVGLNDVELEISMSSNCLILRSSEKANYLEVENETQFEDLRNNISRAINWKYEMYYGIFSVLGKGTFATVHGGYDKTTSEQVAIKILRKKEFKPSEIKLLVSEYEAAKKLNHPNIMKVLDIFNTESTLTIVNELMGGGALADFAYASPGRCLRENVVKEIIFEVVMGVRYLHSCGIAHRDIKPDNMMMKSRRYPYETKIIDFGFCKWYEQGKYWENPMEYYIGTKAFAAPELLADGAYTPQVDTYAVGVSIWNCLTGDIPFHGKSREVLRSLIFRGIPFPEDKFCDKSKEVISIIKSLCNPNPHKRLSADAAFVHKWFDGSEVKIRQKPRQKPPTATLSAVLLTFVFSKKLAHVLQEQEADSEEVMSSLDNLEMGEKRSSFLRKSGSFKLKSTGSFVQRKKDDSLSRGSSFRKFLTGSGERIKKSFSGKSSKSPDSHREDGVL